MNTTKAIYTGRRFTVKNRIVYVWQFDGGEDKWYSKQLVSALIGEQFVLTLDDKGSVYTGGEHKPVKTGGLLPSDNQRVLQWVGLDAAAMQRREDHKAQKLMAARPTHFDEAIEPLRAMVNAVRTHGERAALINRITSELWKA